MDISTPRLRIRDWTHDDAPVALDILSRLEVVKWLADGEPVLMKDLDEAHERIDRWLSRDEPPCGFWGIEVADGGPLHGRLVGSVLLVPLPNNEHGEIEIGWHLHPDAWGCGYASEAGRAVLRHGFEAGLPEIHAVTHLTNDASIGVCLKIGLEDRGRTDLWYDDPSRYFGVLREDWLGRNLD